MTYTKEQYDRIIDNMATSIIFWQEKFNENQEKIEKLTGNNLLKVKVEEKKDLISSYFNLFVNDIE